ncbi:MAG: TonB-dependent receptor [Sphingobacteriales bacterium]|nr:TonB-dependent receptor [Sphingobacteriales bacterium]
MRYAALILYLLFLSGVGSTALAQESSRVTLSGFVRDAQSGEALIGASVYVKELQKGVSANAYGFYSITLDKGSYNLIVNYLGYTEKRFELVMQADRSMPIELDPVAIQTAEVTIAAERKDRNVQAAEMGRVELEVDQIQRLPALFGEVDLLKAIQLLPGVRSAGEGNSGFYVRGGGPDQNLILLDEGVVYNASHLFGFFSVFNPDAVKTMTLTKGGMPAQYGGRLASVLDISMKEGNAREFKARGGIGYIASRLTLEGPIVKDRGSFIVSGRRTFIDLFLREPFISSTSNIAGNGYYFFDLNTKLNYRIGERDRLYASGYFGRDVFNFKSRETGFSVRIPWGNATGSLRWNHLFSDKLFMNTSLIFSDYQFEFGALQQQFDFRIFSGIRDYTAKVDLNWYPNLQHTVRFGAAYIFHRFTPTNAYARSGDVVFDLGKVTRYFAHDAAVYVNDEWDISKRLRVNAGLRFTGFAHVGPFDRFVEDPFRPGFLTDTISYARNEPVARYFNTEPRLSLRYELNDVSSLKASYTRNYQYIHIASFGSVSLPTDVWVPSTDKVKPQDGTQYALGYFRNLKNNAWETSVEVYYKDMENQIDYREGATPDQDVRNNPDNNFVFGRGWSYGAEFFIKKVTGKLNGWIGYTISRTMREFPELNSGNPFPAKYDRRHDVSLVLTYEKSRKWTYGLTWVYATGDALTLPTQRYLMSAGPPLGSQPDGTTGLSNNFYILSGFEQRNDFRQKPYHRLDLSATLHTRLDKRFKGEWVFAVYNTYGRQNPYFIYFDVQGNSVDGNLRVQAKQVSLFSIIPSITYNFTF